MAVLGSTEEEEETEVEMDEGRRTGSVVGGEAVQQLGAAVVGVAAGSSYHSRAFLVFPFLIRGIPRTAVQKTAAAGRIRGFVEGQV